MKTTLYSWKRFWYKREKTITYTWDGFLSDPEEENYSSNVVYPMDSIIQHRCLVLLGEPGMGKTYEMHKIQEILQRYIFKNKESVLPLDLGCSDFYKELCENKLILSWKRGTHQLYLLLDGLDEGMIEMTTLARRLIKLFETYPLNRLNLIISCRTANWPNTFEQGLEDLWGKENFAVFQIAPLRRKDVIEAVLKNDISSSENFINEIQKLSIVPLAIKPITLKFLIEIYKDKGSFPLNTVELYKQGCEKLCQEQEERKESKHRGKLNFQQLFIIAARIAALSIFSDKNIINIGMEENDGLKGCISLPEICGRTEIVNGNLFEINFVEIEEALSTGLFTGSAPKFLKWAHKTYAEFLAAYYLVYHDVPLKQIKYILFHHDESESKIPPQLHETAAWVASMRKDVFHLILYKDPFVLLSSDISLIDDGLKAKLVEMIFEKFDDYYYSNGYSVNRNLYKLNYPGLTKQISEYLKEIFPKEYTKSIHAKRLAISIIVLCKLNSLINILLEMLPDSGRYDIKDNLIYAIENLGNKKELNKLQEFLNNDPDQEKEIIEDNQEKQTIKNEKKQEETSRRNKKDTFDYRKFKKKIDLYLFASERGRFNFWSRINLCFFQENDGFLSCRPEIICTKGWKDISNSTRQKVVNAAKKWIILRQQNRNIWSIRNKNRVFDDCMGAFTLLLNTDKNFLFNLSPEIWDKWIPIIFESPFYVSYFSEKNSSEEIVDIAYKVSYKAINKHILTKIDKTNNDEYSHCDSIFDGYSKYKNDYWNEDLGNLLLESVSKLA